MHYTAKMGRSCLKKRLMVPKRQTVYLNRDIRVPNFSLVNPFFKLRSPFSADDDIIFAFWLED
jgi:hypothetical protein